MSHPWLLANTFAGGMSARLPSGAPASTQLSMVAICASVSESSFLYF
jgi:hypothetical protein